MSEARYQTLYRSEVLPKLKEEFGIKNELAAPRLVKVVINVGFGDAIQDKKALDSVVENIGLIAGQRPVVTTARKSISNFKVREGMPLGCKVTLRGKIMFEFVDRLINLSLPRTRDFQGIPTRGYDGRGNYTFGIKEQTVFAEIDADKADRIHGMDLTFVTTAQNDEQAHALLKHMGMPFEKRNQS